MKFINGKKMITIFLLVPLLLQYVQQTKAQAVQTCMPQPSCTECLKRPGCAWCKKMGFLKPGESSERRCDTDESLTSRSCDKANIVNPHAKQEELKNSDLSNKADNVVQLKPQNLQFALRVGVPHTFRVSFKRAEGYPIDLYYLMDLSFSMKDDLDMIKNLGQDIVNILGTFTKDIRIGFGSFVDKVTLPYVSQVKAKKNHPCPSRTYSCQPAFSFKSILGLTRDAADFTREVSRQMISGNLDSPEAGFDAIMQAAVCQDVIGWKNVTRILVYTSDDTFHIAGDGRLAGIYEPHDGRCHLNGSGFYNGNRFDYPSIGHLSRVLTANNIQLIFAVTKESFAAYKVLSNLIPQSVVGILENDSSNVVQLISEAYNNLHSTVFLEHHEAPQGLEVSYQSHCDLSRDGATWQKKGECVNVKINQQVDFTVRLNVSECLAEKTQFHLKVQGISERLKITVETLCDCNCKPKEVSSEHCSGHGTLSCGSCSCDSGFLGQRCECEQTEGMASLDASCRQNDSPELCSGHGSCECGVCRCRGSHSGQFCQCDDNNCERHNNALCGGNGRCDCGECKCSPGYTGSACQCSTRTDKCRTGANVTCSGRGKCQCNRCHCDQDFGDLHCSAIINACSRFEKCVTCISKNEAKGDVQEICEEQCHPAQLYRVSGPKDFPCSNESLTYEVKLSPDGSIQLHYTDLPRSIDKTYVIILSSVFGIIFIGVAVILICRLLLEMHYRREYHSFLKAQEQTVWRDTNNPLFQNATTTITNPLHIEDN